MEIKHIGAVRNPFALKLKVARLAWKVVYALFFRLTPRGCMNGWRSFLLRLFGAKIADCCVVLPSVKIWAPWNLTMEKYTCLSEDVDCYCVDKITLRYQSIVSQGTFLCTASHDITSRNYNLIHAPIEICPAAWVAAKAIVLPGVKVGEGAVVGAGSVVSKDVAPWTIVAGNPVHEIGKREFKEDK